MTSEEKKALFNTLTLDQLAYLVQMVIDGATSVERERQMLTFSLSSPSASSLESTVCQESSQDTASTSKP
jgi:hypothetical protein